MRFHSNIQGVSVPVLFPPNTTLIMQYEVHPDHPIPEEYTCVCCLGFIQKVAYLGCGHAFCIDCTTQMKRNQIRKCPRCFETIDSSLTTSTMSVAERRRHEALIVRCKRCQDSVKIIDLDAHTQSCRVCPNDGCDRTFTSDMEKHQHAKTMCVHRIVKCTQFRAPCLYDLEHTLPFYHFKFRLTYSVDAFEKCKWMGAFKDGTEHLKSCQEHKMGQTVDCINQAIFIQQARSFGISSITIIPESFRKIVLVATPEMGIKLQAAITQNTPHVEFV
jgi:hypothetical protein